MKQNLIEEGYDYFSRKEGCTIMYDNHSNFIKIVKMTLEDHEHLKKCIEKNHNVFQELCYNLVTHPLKHAQARISLAGEHWYEDNSRDLNKIIDSAMTIGIYVTYRVMDGREETVYHLKGFSRLDELNKYQFSSIKDAVNKAVKELNTNKKYN